MGLVLVAYFYDIVRSDHKAAVCSHEQGPDQKTFYFSFRSWTRRLKIQKNILI